MIKKLDKHNTLYFTSLFPSKCSDSKKKHIVVLGIGGNVGNVKQTFHKLFLMLQKDGNFAVIKSSPLLKNPPFGYLDQDDFYNAILVVKTNLSPKQVLKATQRYENRFKRKRSFQDAPRTLDIDIIFYDDLLINHKDLTIPHPHWYKRESVVIPLGFVS